MPAPRGTAASVPADRVRSCARFRRFSMKRGSKRADALHPGCAPSLCEPPKGLPRPHSRRGSGTELSTLPSNPSRWGGEGPFRALGLVLHPDSRLPCRGSVCWASKPRTPGEAAVICVPADSPVQLMWFSRRQVRVTNPSAGDAARSCGAFALSWQSKAGQEPCANTHRTPAALLGGVFFTDTSFLCTCKSQSF